MKFVPHLSEKVQYLSSFSLTLVEKLCQKTASETFIGGRPGYKKETLFGWLLIKKVTNWSYRTIASMAGVSHPTLIRANTMFLNKGIYQKIFTHLVKQAYKQGFIKGEKVALDSSFVKTFSKKQELGSEHFNAHKKAQWSCPMKIFWTRLSLSLICVTVRARLMISTT